jgi:hypothetical protein
MRTRKMSPDPRERDRVASLISSEMRELNAIVAIMITDNWAADEVGGSAAHRSMQTPFPGRTEALVWPRCRRTLPFAADYAVSLTLTISSRVAG